MGAMWGERAPRRRSRHAVWLLLTGLLAALVLIGPATGSALAKSGSWPIDPPSSDTAVFTVSLAGKTYSYTWADISGTGTLGAPVTQSYLLDTADQDPQEWSGVWLRTVLADLESRSGITLQDDWKLKVTAADAYACSLFVGDVMDPDNNYLVATDPVQGCTLEDPTQDDWDNRASHPELWYEPTYTRICTNGDYGNTAFPARLVRTTGSMTVLDASGNEITTPATAHDALGLVVAGDAVSAPASMKTYSGDAFWITAAELAELKSSKGTTGGFASLWTTKKYSYCENHGTPVYGYATAAGVDLKGLLADAGLTAEQIAALDRVTVTATDGYAITLDLQVPRYVFTAIDAATGDTVDPMLALYRDDAEAYADLPSEATTTIDGDYPTLMYGQTTTAESNECGYVSDAREVTLPSASPALKVDAPDAYSTAGRQNTDFALADLVAEGNEQRVYTVGGAEYTCDGLDLGTLLGEAHGRICPQDTILVTTSTGTVDPGLKVADATDGAYAVAYYSEDDTGTAVANGTQCMLYGDDVAIGDVTSLTIEHVDATTSLALTSPTVWQTRAYMAKGSKLALRSVTTKAPGATAADPVTWTSSNTKIATVASNGTVTAKARGTAVITATSDSLQASFTVNVLARTVTATKVTLPRTRTVIMGTTPRLSVRVYPSNATVTITWKSSNTAVLKADRGGNLKPVKKGRATITVRTSNGRTARCVVTVKPQP